MTEAVKKARPQVQRMAIRDGQRMFEGGMEHRLTQSWDSSSYTADQVVYSQLPTLRARARHQLRNNDYVMRLVQMLTGNVVGANGFKARSKVVDRNGNVDRPARQVIQRGWQDFSDDASLVELCELIMASLVTDGEAFVYMRTTRQGTVRPELIDPVRIDVEYNDTHQGNLVMMGIEYDADLVPVAYHVNDRYEQGHPGQGDQANAQIPRTRIPAEHIRHVFRKLYVGQKRGIPWIAVSLNRLFQLGRYEEAALTAARIGAAKMGFFTSSEDEQFSGDDGENMTINAEAGTFENIGRLNFQAFDPSYPAGEFQGFVNRALQGIAAGMNVDYPVLGNDLGSVNYSSARVGQLETREYYKTIQAWLIRNLIKPLFRSWLALEYWAQRLTIGGNPMSRGFEYYLPMEFVGRRWDWVDPQKDANGKKILYDMKVISLSQIIREQGNDPDEVFDEIAEENKRLADLQITPQQVLDKAGVSDDADAAKEG